MYKLKVKRQNDKIRIVSKLSGDTKVNSSEFEYLCMMRDYRIAVPVSYSMNKLVYDIGYTMTLSQLLSSFFTEEAFFNIVKEFVQVVSLLTNSHMSVNNLLLDTDYVFVDPTGQHALYIYQPVYNVGAQINVFVFLQELTQKAVMPLGTSAVRMRSFNRFLASQRYFSEEAFMDYLEPKEPESEKRYTERIESRRTNNDYSDNEPYDKRNTYDGRAQYDSKAVTEMYQRERGSLSDDEISEDLINTSVLGETAVLGLGSQSSAPSLERKKNGEKVLVNQTSFKIGSDRPRTNYWVSNNRAVSRVHATIISRDGRYVLQDNNSTNGSYLNGNKLAPGIEYELHSGDRIVLADEEFVFVIR